MLVAMIEQILRQFGSDDQGKSEVDLQVIELEAVDWKRHVTASEIPDINWLVHWETLYHYGTWDLLWAFVWYNNLW